MLRHVNRCQAPVARLDLGRVECNITHYIVVRSAHKVVHACRQMSSNISVKFMEVTTRNRYTYGLFKVIKPDDVPAKCRSASPP